MRTRLKKWLRFLALFWLLGYLFMIIGCGRSTPATPQGRLDAASEKLARANTDEERCPFFFTEMLPYKVGLKNPQVVEVRGVRCHNYKLEVKYQSVNHKVPENKRGSLALEFVVSSVKDGKEVETPIIPRESQSRLSTAELGFNIEIEAAFRPEEIALLSAGNPYQMICYVNVEYVKRKRLRLN